MFTMIKPLLDRDLVEENYGLLSSAELTVSEEVVPAVGLNVQPASQTADAGSAEEIFKFDTVPEKNLKQRDKELEEKVCEVLTKTSTYSKDLEKHIRKAAVYKTYEGKINFSNQTLEIKIPEEVRKISGHTEAYRAPQTKADAGVKRSKAFTGRGNRFAPLATTKDVCRSRARSNQEKSQKPLQPEAGRQCTPSVQERNLTNHMQILKPLLKFSKPTRNVCSQSLR